MNIEVILSSFISGLLSAMGLGGGTVLIIYLTTLLNIEQKNAQGINLVFFILTGIFALISNLRKKLIDTRELKNLLLFSIPGLIVGFLLLNLISAQLLKKLFAYILLFIGIKTLFAKNKAAPTNTDTK